MAEDRFCLGRIDHAAGEDQVHRLGLADRTGKPLRPAAFLGIEPGERPLISVPLRALAPPSD